MFLLDHLEQRRAQRPFKPARDDRQRRFFIVEMGYQLARKMCRRLRMTLHQFLSHREQPLGAPPRRRDEAVSPKSPPPSLPRWSCSTSIARERRHSTSRRRNIGGTAQSSPIFRGATLWKATRKFRMISASSAPSLSATISDAIR